MDRNKIVFLKSVNLSLIKHGSFKVWIIIHLTTDAALPHAVYRHRPLREQFATGRIDSQVACNRFVLSVAVFGGVSLIVTATCPSEAAGRYLAHPLDLTSDVYLFASRQFCLGV